MDNKMTDVSAKKYYVGAASFKVLRSNQSFVRGLDLAKVTAKHLFRGAETIKVYTSSGEVVFKYDKALHEAEQKNAQSSDFDRGDENRSTCNYVHAMTIDTARSYG